MASQALLKAVTSARFTQTRLLLQMGANVNAKDPEGRTPIIRALCLPNEKVRTNFLRLLLKAGALVSLCDRQARNALMWACSVGSVENVSLLLHHADVDLNINAQNSEGQTALWTSVNGDRVEIVQELAQALSKHGLNFEVEDRTGVTPAQLAAKLGHFRCLQAMITHLDSVDKSVSTLFNMANLSKIFKSLSITIGPKCTTEMTQPQESTKAVQDPPTIQITSAEGHQVLSQAPRHKTENRHSSHPLPPLKLYENPSKSYTSFSYGRFTVSHIPSPNPDRSQRPSTERHPHREHITRLPYLGRSAVDDNGVTQSRHHRHITPLLSSTPRNQSRSSSDLTELLSERSELVVFPPLVRITVRDEGSVRHRLPELFDIHAQQISDSFRKAAAPKPPPLPKAKPEPGSNWSKLKGVALIARLSRNMNSFTKGVALAAAAAAGVAPDDDSLAEDANSAGGLAKLFLPKRRLPASIKQRNG
ncbi:uncharacterized protein LOC143292001 [Babylonia areolata]|uniref:uncharacterized protein LOC143292001 n=1 Tax=Babylonia areolata TaxID=304850 RepID=UPI003FD3A5F3